MLLKEKPHPSVKDNKMKSISVTDLAHALETQKDAILLDVREEDEYAEKHIAGAQHVPLSDLPRAMQDVTLPQEGKIYVHCLKGGRSAQAIEALSGNVFQGHNVYNVEGGLKAWEEEGLPLIYPEKLEKA
jgi:rhodanese-related sulfurtransferase